MNIKKTILTITILIMLLVFSCEKDLNISDFTEDFIDYSPELKIEAIADPDNMENTIVRMYRTITIDDTTVFNERDDDGDWNPLEDDLGEDGILAGEDGVPEKDKGEGNGRPDSGEPHVDEYDETLGKLYDTTATVTMTDLSSGQIINFSWQWEADSFKVYRQRRMDPNDIEDFDVEFSVYGAYRPNNFPTVSGPLLLEIVSQQFNQTIDSETTPFHSIEFIDTSFNLISDDTLYYYFGGDNYLLWKSRDVLATSYFVTMEEVAGDDSLIMVYSHPTFSIEELTLETDGMPAGGESFFPMLQEGLYKLTVDVINQSYSRYLYSSLALNNPERSNLRDQNGNTVMGFFGSKASRSIYIRIKYF